MPDPLRTETREQPAYFVWSIEHGAWWRPNRCGYASSVLAAGIYTKAEADDIAGDSGRERAVPATEHLPEIRAAVERWGQLLSRVQPERPQEAWQPLSTAPTDRWVWLGSTKGDRISAYRWDTGSKSYGSRGAWFAGTGWWPSVDRFFTHWAEITSGTPPPSPTEPRS
jgi:hypothetical protein